MRKDYRENPQFFPERHQTMSEKLKNNPTVDYQIKMLARLAVRIDEDPRHPIDIIRYFFDFNSEQHEKFLEEYHKPRHEGDDPLEIA